MQGVFLRFNLDYEVDGEEVPYDKQAKQILDVAKSPKYASNSGVAIVYSANEGQTDRIAATYAAGDWRTGTGGANQASVMAAMEDLLAESPWDELQGRVRIAPITTIPNGSPTEADWLKIVQRDLSNIQELIQNGWVVLGWMNQESATRFAVGGGVAGKLPDQVEDLIQTTLTGHLTS